MRVEVDVAALERELRPLVVGPLPERLAECLALLRWSRQGLASVLGYASDNTVRQWLAGRVRVPAEVAAWLETLARHHARHPPPRRVVHR